MDAERADNKRLRQDLAEERAVHAADVTRLRADVAPYQKEATDLKAALQLANRRQMLVTLLMNWRKRQKHDKGTGVHYHTDNLLLARPQVATTGIQADVEEFAHEAMSQASR